MTTLPNGEQPRKTIDCLCELTLNPWLFHFRSKTKCRIKYTKAITAYFKGE